MLTYTILCQFRELAPRILGMDLDAFSALYKELEVVYTQAMTKSKYTVRVQKKRSRRAGGGRHHTLDLQTRLLLYLFWCHARPTQSVLCQMYGLSRGSIAAILSDMYQGLRKLPKFRFKNDPQDRRRLRTVQDVMIAFPELYAKINPENSGGAMI